MACCGRHRRRMNDLQSASECRRLLILKRAAMAARRYHDDYIITGNQLTIDGERTSASMTTTRRRKPWKL